MHLADEELQTDDGVDDYNEEHQEGDVQEGDHSLDDGVQDHLQTWDTRPQPIMTGQSSSCQESQTRCHGNNRTVTRRGKACVMLTNPLSKRRRRQNFN